MGSSHDRRKERRLKEIVKKTMEEVSANSTAQLPGEPKPIRRNDPLDAWRTGLNVLGLLGLATSVVTSFPSLAHLLPDWAAVVILIIFIALLSIRLAIAKTLVRYLNLWMRVATGIVVFFSASGLLISEELKYRREHIPYCYAFFYRGVGPDGSVIGGRVILAVANATKEPARNVVVTLLSSKPGDQYFDPSMQKKVFLPVVYPLPFSPPPGSNLVFTPLGHWDCSEFFKTEISFEPKDFGSDFQVALLTENGEGVEETIRWLDGNRQVITLTRLRDGATLAKNACPPFDFFGGCLIVRTN